jgi:hypothetical protein
MIGPSSHWQPERLAVPEAPTHCPPESLPDDTYTDREQKDAALNGLLTDTATAYAIMPLLVLQASAGSSALDLRSPCRT